MSSNQREGDGTALAPAAAPGSLATFRGHAGAVGEILRSPASGLSCVHWRLRIFETVAPGMELVHEVSSPEPVELLWRPGDGAAPRPLRIAAERAHIEAQPTLHREGSGGAAAVARHFGLPGRVRVEEVLVRQGEDIQAEGVLFDPRAGGPFRAADLPAELHEATVRLGTGLSLRPALLPWALGTAAALAGAAGLATALTKLWTFTVAEAQAPAAEKIGPVKVRRSVWP